MIYRKKLLERNNPHLTEICFESPLTVGNGETAFTVDQTGLQSFYEEQEKAHVPLCTMSQWGWHTAPSGINRDLYYSPSDVVKTEYKYLDRSVYYASKEEEGNGEIYNWLRQNPHRLNLARIAFLWNGEEISSKDICDIDQTLNLYEGVIYSKFKIENYKVEVRTLCAQNSDTIGVSVKSKAAAEGKVSVLICFPYGSRNITGSDWKHEDFHETRLLKCNVPDTYIFERRLDRDKYYCALNGQEGLRLTELRKHNFIAQGKGETFEFTISFSKDEFCDNQTDCHKPVAFNQALKESREEFENFFNTCGIIDLHNSKDKRAPELERRITLSLYLLKIQSCGSMPPQETGLTCNSWYGKFHLEMYPWHCAWTPLYNKGELIYDSLRWYLEHLPRAIENAESNGYKGARWPKMVAYDAYDSPSTIAVLLIWQQPHIIYMLELLYKELENKSTNNQRQTSGEAEREEIKLLNKFWDVVRESAVFMCDFAAKNENTGYFDLPAPLIPAQEEHDPATTKNPAFELEYWSFALKIADKWAKRLGKSGENWLETAKGMAPLPKQNNLYLACETCPETFERFNKDHPSMLGALGLLPGYNAEHDVMENTLKKVLECWDFSTMWGWDFAMMAMTAVRLNDPNTAIEILLKDTPKNSYVESGNNYQRLRTDLPVYLPGNGSLLLAAAMMCAGYNGCEQKLPGFPRNGMWDVEFENISPFPY